MDSFSSRLPLHRKHPEPSLPPEQLPQASRRKIPNLLSLSQSLPLEQAPQAPLRRIPVSPTASPFPSASEPPKKPPQASRRRIPNSLLSPSPSLPPEQALQAPLRRILNIPLAPTTSPFPSLSSLPLGQIHNISVSGTTASRREKNNEEEDYEPEEDHHYSEEDDHYSEDHDHYSVDDDYFSGDDDDEKLRIILRVELTYHQRSQLCSIVEELPMPEMKHYVCTLMKSTVIPGEGKMIEMDQVNCQFCHQPMDNSRHSNRRASSFKIIMQENYEHFVTIPCYFKEQLNKYSDKWLHALVGGHMLEFYLEKSTNSTTMYGPWWSYFLMSHYVAVNDVVTFKLPTEDDSDDEIGDEDAEVLEYEEEADDAFFEVTVADPIGNKKNLPSYAWEPPVQPTGKEISDMTMEIQTAYGKLQKKKRIGRKKMQRVEGEEDVENKEEVHTIETTFKKRSIFFQLEYWKFLLVRHNLDSMHIEKNVFDNVVNTLLDVDKRSKDNAKARMDMKRMKIREHLHIDETQEKPELPDALYYMDSSKKKLFCGLVKNVRFPDNHASSMFNKVRLEKNKFVGLKTHDCHILFEEILPLAVMKTLPEEVAMPLVKLAKCFKVITSKIVSNKEIEMVEEQLPEILCQLEKIFPPTFFDIMEHLVIHLPAEVRLAGPVQFRNMWSTEMFIGNMKNWICG
ncbi:hypothetical protein ACQ4PT_021549 [Festuca glaucescens]